MKLGARIGFFGVLLWGLTAGTVQGAEAAKAKAKAPPPDLAWHDVTEWGVEGRAWAGEERARYYDRFPARAEGKVPPAVWGLSRDSSGMMARFRTDATVIWARYRLRSDRVAMPHMPATGVSGVDLYARAEDGRWRWVNVTRPDRQDVEQELISGIEARSREYALYLPLYNGIESLSIGVGAGARFEGLKPRAEKPVVFYGTSITHGACASRPGMTHVAILGRRLDRPTVNLGFSGNGKMDASVGEFLCLIDAGAYVIDCLPNMDARAVAERAEPLVRQLRAARPGVPVILVEDRRFTNTWIRPERVKFHDENHAALRGAFERLRGAGVTGLHYIPGDDLLGEDGDGATDGSHPNDLGFVRQADAFEPVLRAALGADSR